MITKAADIFKTAGRRVCAWAEQSNTVHIKAVDEHGDPVELTPEELKSLIDYCGACNAIVKPCG